MHKQFDKINFNTTQVKYLNTVGKLSKLHIIIIYYIQVKTLHAQHFSNFKFNYTTIH